MGQNELKAQTQEKFSALEQKLAGAFRPVQAPREFVQTVRQRMKFASPHIAVERAHDPQKLIFIIGGAVSGLLLILTIARAIYYFAKERRTA
jgi:hypothetical protein